MFAKLSAVLAILFPTSALSSVILSSFCLNFVLISVFEAVKSSIKELKSARIELLNSSNLSKFSTSPRSSSFLFSAEIFSNFILVSRSNASLFPTPALSRVILSSFCLNFVSISFFEDIKSSIRELKSSRIELLNSSNLSKFSPNPRSSSFLFSAKIFSNFIPVSRSSASSNSFFISPKSFVVAKPPLRSSIARFRVRLC